MVLADCDTMETVQAAWSSGEAELYIAQEITKPAGAKEITSVMTRFENRDPGGSLPVFIGISSHLSKNPSEYLTVVQYLIPPLSNARVQITFPAPVDISALDTFYIMILYPHWDLLKPYRNVSGNCDGVGWLWQDTTYGWIQIGGPGNDWNHGYNYTTSGSQPTCCKCNGTTLNCQTFPAGTICGQNNQYGDATQWPYQPEYDCGGGTTPWYMQYLPFILAGIGGAILITALLYGKSGQSPPEQYPRKENKRR